uniref:Retrotransposon protein, putative, unclassified n=1 Tax=Oryza sativa subsp. japonica TaxID=39947 RepID=Q7G3Q6_ORYSJ|nr:retrotransposon protein, putative, unclassified [Oryza sativa Japonica Group]
MVHCGELCYAKGIVTASIRVLSSIATHGRHDVEAVSCGYSVCVPRLIPGRGFYAQISSEITSEFPGVTDMIEDIMDDFSVYGKNFGHCLQNLNKTSDQLLAKDAPFEFDDACLKSFEILKKALVSAPIIQLPDWTLPFEIMCDASDFAVGAVLGQTKDKKHHASCYASKTLTGAQLNYATTEKGLLVVVFAIDKFRRSQEGLKIIERCHASPYGGHYGAFRTQAKIWQSGFFWTNDVQRLKRIRQKMHKLPKARRNHCSPCNAPHIQFSRNCEYILVAVDYVSKWVEAMSCSAADARHAKKMFTEIIFPRFGTPRMVISDGGSHFIDKTFRDLLREMGAKHNVATPYHPQTSGQEETSNK